MVFSNLGAKLFKDDSILDDARYIAVATGRLEPYKRALARQPLFFSRQLPLLPQQIQIENDGVGFLKLWATRSRAKKAGLKKVQSASLLEIYQQLEKLCQTEKSAIESNTVPKKIGILIDSGLTNEIYIEPHQISEIYDLSQHLPTPAAFTPIARETLTLQTTTKLSDIQLPEPLKSNLPKEIAIHYAQIGLNGLHGENWNLLFLDIEQADFDALTTLKLRYPQWLIIPHNCSLKWVNDILEEYRPEAVSLSPQNRA